MLLFVIYEQNETSLVITKKSFKKEQKKLHRLRIFSQ